MENMRPSLLALALLIPALACARRPAAPVAAQSAFAADGCAGAAEISQRASDSALVASAAPPASGSYVLASFYIDATGKPEMATFAVIRASDPSLVSRAKEMASRARFRPFEPLPGCAVRGLIVRPFTFPTGTAQQ